MYGYKLMVMCHFQQIKLPDLLSGSSPDSPEGRFMEIICSCLRAKPVNRPSASDVEMKLFSIMQQEGWSS